MTQIKNLIIAITALITCCPAMAQPGAVKKAVDAVFTLTTFKNDGSILATAKGVFIAQGGTAVSLWSPFAGADHAVIVDAKGNRIPVDAIMGANEIYDLSKFRIAGKETAVITKADKPASVGAEVWILSEKKSGAHIKASVKAAESFMTKYMYYVLETDAGEIYNGCPVVDNNGRLLGIFNGNTSTKNATDARYACDFTINGLSQNEPTLKQTNIRIALPEDQEQAVVAMMIAGENGGENYEATINDFIRQFPSANDGYFSQAMLSLAKGDTLKAQNTMQDALKKVSDKEEAHFNYARVLFQSGMLDKALEEIHSAYAISPQPQYKQMEAQILYEKGEYQQAYDIFLNLTKSPIRNGELFYQAMQAKQKMNGTDAELLALLDSAVAVCDTPYTVVAAPYFLARGFQLDKMEQYRKAMADLYIYEALMVGRLNGEFYFLRGQSEAKGKIFQPALNDLAHAVYIDPKNIVYWAELASLYLRVGKYEEAMKAAKQCTEMDAEASEGWLILGVSQAESGNKTEGIKNIEKAQSLGNEQAGQFLSKYK